MKRHAFPYEFKDEPDLADRFFKEMDAFPYEDHGGRTPMFNRWLKARGISSDNLDCKA
jgi:hypothetical protein